mmetsp:Transcript_41833/g.76454  ORF Transcript_41833/g.76454 Transcript_41833/m.76454 type:complete len:961 (+) Transcript_41833:75-2957(+)
MMKRRGKSRGLDRFKNVTTRSSKEEEEDNHRNKQQRQQQQHEPPPPQRSRGRTLEDNLQRLNNKASQHQHRPIPSPPPPPPPLPNQSSTGNRERTRSQPQHPPPLQQQSGRSSPLQHRQQRADERNRQQQASNTRDNSGSSSSSSSNGKPNPATRTRPSVDQNQHLNSSLERNSNNQYQQLGSSRSSTPPITNTNSQNSRSSTPTNTTNSQHPISKINNTNNTNDYDIPNSNNIMAGLTGPGKSSTSSKLATIAKVYGPSANIYTDVLKISPTATTSEIREAFFCLRYANYQTLDTAKSGALTSDERKEVEMEMDAITGAFQIVSDGGRRKVYDASLSTPTKAADGNHPRRRSSGPVDLDASVDSETDSTGFPTATTTTTPTRKVKSKLVRSAKASSPSKLSPSKSDNNSRSHLPIGQRRSVFRRRVARRSAPSGGSAGTTAKSGMNASRRAVARDVTGGLNTRPSPSESSDGIFGNGALTAGNGSGNRSDRSDGIFAAGSTRTHSRGDSIFTESTMGGAVEAAVGGGGADGAGSGNRSESPKWADFGSGAATGGKASPSVGREARDDHHGATNNNMGWSQDAEDAEPLPDGVSNLNAREQLLFKNQMYHRQQKQQAEQHHQRQPHQINATPSRLGSRYDAHERTDKYTDAPALASPTGVEEFDNTKAWGQNIRHSNPKEVEWNGRRRKPSPTTTTDSNTTEEEEPSLNRTASATVGTASLAGGGSVVSNAPEEDDDTCTRASSAYDDDTRTYDDATTHEDETTLGTETVDDATNDESTWASQYEDDATSCAAGSVVPRTAGGDGGKHSPGHKKGTKPMPILKSGSRNALKRSESDGKRVTIHSHRGRGDESDDFSLFEGASCPAIPSFTAIQEEVTGTYTDFKSALHQVSNAFVISPDDIDRLADKIRDAKIELGENYHKQVKERQLGNPGGGGKQVVNKVGSKQVKKRLPVVKTEMQL